MPDGTNGNSKRETNGAEKTKPDPDRGELMRRIVIAPCLFLLLLPVSATAAAPPVKGKGSVEFRVVGRNANLPELAKLIVVSPRGDLRNMKSHPLDDEILKRALRASKPGEKVFVEVMASVEAETTVATLIDAVARIKKHADPTAETVIFLYFQGLPSSPQGGK
jgi:hypothetical protein